jgi:predicted GNAT family acetyltransferase
MALTDRNPVQHCFVRSRLDASNLDPWRSQGELWGYDEDGEITALLYMGANAVPVETHEAARIAFATRARGRGRRCSSLVGPAAEVLDLWERIGSAWGNAREVRTNQPVMAITGDSVVAPDPDVRFSRKDEIDIVLPACIAMFTEEVGVSPTAHGAGPAYRARILELIQTHRSLVRVDSGQVTFKSEIGSIGGEVCQVQGVWVDPEQRGRGIAVPAMAQVVRLAQMHAAATVSLYVNDYNVKARRVYERVGFDYVGTFATVLLALD